MWFRAWNRSEEFRTVQRLARKAGVDGRISHSLRHSCAMTLLQAGVDTSVIALWLGHAGVRSTTPTSMPTSSLRRKPSL